jgi:hypothetical protein
MHATQLISIGLFTAAVVLTVYAWSDRVRHSNEGFQNQTSNPLSLPIPSEPIPALVPQNPTDADAIAAYKLLLKYTSQNLAKGLRFMTAFGRIFFKEPINLRTDIDPANLMNNYVSPLQVV